MRQVNKNLKNKILIIDISVTIQSKTWNLEEEFSSIQYFW